MAAVYVETENRIKRRDSQTWAGRLERISEGFWFLVCLVLFMILGPFAGPIALVFMLSNRVHESEMQEPELLNEN